LRGERFDGAEGTTINGELSLLLRGDEGGDPHPLLLLLFCSKLGQLPIHKLVKYRYQTEP